MEVHMSASSICHVFCLLAPISLAVTLLAHAAVFVVLAPRKRKNTPEPPISILKPVKGVDAGLYENLASLARQDYSAFELVIGAEDRDDPALEVARQVQRDFPGARILVAHGCRPLGLNPKVNLLAALSELASHEHLLISDSNVRVLPEYLRETAAELADPEVGLVTNILVGSGCGLGALLENLHLGSFVASAASFARVVGNRACVIGKSMLFRRKDLERLGGFWSVRNVLAEDYVIGRMFELAGFKVALSPHVVGTVNDGWSLERFINRHLRWAQMRRRLSPAAFFGELILNPVLWIALAVVFSRLDLRLCGLALFGVAVKCAGDGLVLRRLGGAPRLAQLLVIPFKDLLIAGLWAVGAFRRTVNWRGNVLRIEAGSRLERADSFEGEPVQEAA
jgi:ceramide glucosyltransferase